MILGNMNILNTTPPFKKFSTMPFLRYGFQHGAPPMPGDKLLSNKQLILGNLNMLNASPPLRKVYPAILEIWLLTWSAIYARG
jgi:hypothetical protein